MASHTKWRAYTTGVAVFAAAFLITFLAASVFTPSHDTNAEGTNDDQSSAGGYSLSLSTTASIDLNLTVGPIDVMTVGQGTVNVATTSTNGYKLYIGMKTNSTSLTKSGTSDTIAGTTGTITTPQSLTRGTWGYAIPSNTAHLTANGFSSSYTTMTSSMPDPSYRFATPPANNSNPTLIATNTTATTGDTYPIYYGVRANKDIAEGAYSNNVLFTAVADAGSTPSASVLPTAAKTNTATPFVLTTTLYSTSTVDLNVYFLTQSQYNTVNGGTPVESVTSALTCTKTSSSPVAMSCTAPASSNGTYYIYAKSPRYGVTYSTTFTVATAPSFYTISNMQDMTTAICNSVVTPSVSAVDVDTNGMHLGDPAYVPQRVLSDVRDGNSYRIRKLADGKCWMTENLRLVGPFKPDKTDSDVTWNRTDTNAFELTASYSDAWCTADSSSCDNRSLILDSGNTTYGTYYNWYSATAGTGKFETTSSSASSSICPKGWRLPVGGDSGEFSVLYYRYNSYSSMVNTTTGPGFVLSGSRSNNTIFSPGTRGYYWSSAGYTNSEAYCLALTDSHASVGYKSNKYYGFTIRCLAQ